MFLTSRRSKPGEICEAPGNNKMTSMVTAVTVRPKGLSPAPVGSTEHLEVHLGFREGGEVGTLWGLFEGVPFIVNSS
jgi:hypothetical protein